MAERAQWPAVRARLGGLYGESEVFDTLDGFGARTGNGVFVVMDKVGVERAHSSLPPDLASEERPSCVSIHVTVPDLAMVRPFLDASQARHADDGDQVRLLDAAAYGNIFLVLEPGPTAA
jgi:hypothetical protein